MTDVSRTPAETLRAAADRLDELAGPASDAPWRPVEARWMAANLKGVVQSAAGDILGHHYVADATWMSTLGPQVAAPLSAWLRTSAADAELRAAAGQNPEQYALIDAALAFARTVLGETAPTPAGEIR